MKRVIKTEYLLGCLLLSFLASVFFLRQNNLKMVSLRNEVLYADKSQGDTAGAISNLNNHVFNHMNSQLNQPVELVYSYNREVERALTQSDNAKAQTVYKQAIVDCKKRDIPSEATVNCIAQYVKNKSTLEAPSLPDKKQFSYSYISPLWSPDLAGFSVLITIVLICWLFVRFVRSLLLRSSKKDH